MPEARGGIALPITSTATLPAPLKARSELVDGKIYIGDQDGDVVVFELSSKLKLLEKNPMGVAVDTFDTAAVPDEKIIELVEKYFDLTPHGIIAKLQLQQPIYQKTASYGHFGRTDLDVAWEDTDMAATLKKEAGV